MGSIPCLSSLLPTLHSPEFQPRNSKPDPSVAAAAATKKKLKHSSGTLNISTQEEE